MPKPVVYLAFANDNDAHLPLLKEESRQLMNILSGLHDKQAIEVYRDESTSVEDLVTSFNRFDARIAIFHYGGHAQGTKLEFEEGAGQADGLARLFSQQDNLQLVFLNGCSTKGQVDRLLDLGVKAVIATSVPIEDAKAKDFSAWFYQALSVKRGIQQAFEFAVAALSTKYSITDIPAIVEYRGQGRSASSDIETLAWGLYINDTDQTVLNWKLPDTPIQRFLTNPMSDYKPNDYLPRILGAMAMYDPSLKKVIEDVQAGKKDKRQVLPDIIENLPWTISAQLQKLISRSESMRSPSIERLKQTINTYLMAAQVILYILVSQLWEELQKGKSGWDLSEIEKLLSLDLDSTGFFDYVDAFHRLGKQFKDLGGVFFVTELNELLSSIENKDRFYKSYLLLESIREQINSGNLDLGQVPQLCEESENSLTIFIGTISFLIKYKMIAIRTISVTSTRYKDVVFYHKIGSLNATDGSYLNLASEARPFQNHAESGAIVIVDNLDNDKIHNFLSLSPFIIDNNSFLDTNQESLDIYLFSHADGANFVYKNVNSHAQKMIEHNTYTVNTGYEEKLEVKNDIGFDWGQSKTVKPYQILKDQFDRLKKDVQASIQG